MKVPIDRHSQELERSRDDEQESGITRIIEEREEQENLKQRLLHYSPKENFYAQFKVHTFFVRILDLCNAYLRQTDAYINS